MTKTFLSLFFSIFLMLQGQAFGYGAVAVSKNPEGVYSWAVNVPSISEAMDAAIGACKRGGGNECHIPKDVDGNDMLADAGMYISIARSGVTEESEQMVGLGFSSDELESVELALADCQDRGGSNCKVEKTFLNQN